MYFVAGDTPLKLADYFKLGGVYNRGSIPDRTMSSNGNAYLSTSVMHADFGSFPETVFQNREVGYSYFVVG